ncbi:MAG: sn-glycerol-1-phosphate dehydrogenase [Clostridia bacterium]|nr:sn-glycerol-1-phosphate dehydrogenase [Clostridia bacterium]
MSAYSVEELIRRPAFCCGCGKIHTAHLKDAVIGAGAVCETAAMLRKHGGTKAYILADENTFAAAGERVISNLDKNGVRWSLHLYGSERAEPDEKMIGSAVLHFDHSCDSVMAIGSGVLNDTAKIVSKLTGLPLVTVATAPSMDGFASSTSSVVRDGLKVSVDSSCPVAVIGDTDILCASPMHMMLSGLGDMLAKYVSICEWRIGNLVTGEYYCGEVAAMVRAALKACVDNADGLLSRDPVAVGAVMEGLVLSGIAADWAGVSRPVSGVEHYFSHIWDMRALEFGAPFDLHGIQCGVGTLYALRGYEALKKMTPDASLAKKRFAAFDRERWENEMRDFLGGAAEPMIAAAKNSARYDPAAHEARLSAICSKWDGILDVIERELPSAVWLEDLLRSLGAPCSPAEFGLSDDIIGPTFRFTKDIRDKYILSALAWDMGVSEEIAEAVCT